MTLPLGDSTVTGTLAGVEPKTNGWMKFSILQPGQQYPDKVETKKPDLVQAAMALIGQMVTAQVTCVDSNNPNPNAPGTTFINRYLNSIGPAAQGAPAYQQPQQQAQPQYQQPMQPQAAPSQPQAPAQPDGMVKELRIMREVGLKAAAAIYNSLPPDQQNPIGMIEASEVFVAYFFYGPARFGVRAFNDPVAPAQAPAAQAQPVQQQSQEQPQPQQQQMAVNTAETPCAGCNAAPGTPHAPDCLPF
jgi:hypothetical protein